MALYSRISDDRSVAAAPARSRRSRSVGAVVTVAALTIASLAFVAPAASADTSPPVGVEETVAADPLPTAQIDGVVWTQAIASNTVWVGGEFTTARPAGAAAGVNTVPRANLMAYNLQTGVMTSWNPGANGAIKTIVPSPDGSRIYVGGTFTTIAGQTRYRVAAFDTATGALLPWAPYSNAGVTAIATSGDTVFLVGNFTSVAGGARTRLGAVTASTGALLPLTATLTGGYGVHRPSSSTRPGRKVVVSGSFESTNGSTNPGRGLAALDASDGRVPAVGGELAHPQWRDEGRNDLARRRTATACTAPATTSAAVPKTTSRAPSALAGPTGLSCGSRTATATTTRSR